MKYWQDEKYENNFQQLKEKLLIALVLATPVNSDKYIIYSDDFIHELEFVLIQDDIMKPYGKNYCHDLELVVIVLALKLWRDYLYRKKCQVYTYHKSTLLHINTVSKFQCQHNYCCLQIICIVVRLIRFQLSTHISFQLAILHKHTSQSLYKSIIVYLYSSPLVSSASTSINNNFSFNYQKLFSHFSFCSYFIPFQ